MKKLLLVLMFVFAISSSIVNAQTANQLLDSNQRVAVRVFGLNLEEEHNKLVITQFYKLLSKNNWTFVDPIDPTRTMTTRVYFTIKRGDRYEKIDAQIRKENEKAKQKADTARAFAGPVAEIINRITKYKAPYVVNTTIDRGTEAYAQNQRNKIQQETYIAQEVSITAVVQWGQVGSTLIQQEWIGTVRFKTRTDNYLGEPYTIFDDDGLAEYDQPQGSHVVDLSFEHYAQAALFEAFKEGKSTATELKFVNQTKGN